MPQRPVDIPWPLSSAPGARPQESNGRLINCYAEPVGEGGKDGVIYRRSAGLALFVTTGFTGFRGAVLINNLVFAVVGTRLLTIDAGGSVVNVGALAGTKPVTFARNNKSPTPDIQCVDPDNGAFACTTASVTPFNGGGNLPAPNSVFSQDDYIFWTIADGRVFAAGPNATTVNTQTFTTIKSRASDTLLRGVPYKGLAYFFKTSSCEVWNNTAQPAPAFPYSRLSVLDRGLFGANAIAGHQDGFGTLLWVGDDAGVYRLSEADGKPEKVSPPDLDRLIAAVSDTSTLQANCYVHDAKRVWGLSSPTWTWEFNLNTEKWNERDSLMSGEFTRWRGMQGVKAFGRWLLGDNQTGNIVAVMPGAFTEVGAPMRWRMESGPVRDFPNRMIVARADFDFITGVGQTSTTVENLLRPRVGVSWSDDDGVHWKNPLLRELGAQANAARRVYVTSTGQSGPAGRRWRLDVSDGVYVGFRGGRQSADPQAQ